MIIAIDESGIHRPAGKSVIALVCVSGRGEMLRDKRIRVRKIKTVNDDSYPLVRLADAIAGVVRYHSDNPNPTAVELYKLIEPKIEFIHIHKK
jgi:hypothetical protein